MTLTIDGSTTAWFGKKLEKTVINVRTDVPDRRTTRRSTPDRAAPGARALRRSGDADREGLRRSTRVGYDAIEGGLGGPAMEAITGKVSATVKTSSKSEDELAVLIRTAKDADQAITAGADWAIFKSTEGRRRRKDANPVTQPRVRGDQRRRGREDDRPPGPVAASRASTSCPMATMSRSGSLTCRSTRRNDAGKSRSPRARWTTSATSASARRSICRGRATRCRTAASGGGLTCPAASRRTPTTPIVVGEGSEVELGGPLAGHARHRQRRRTVRLRRDSRCADWPTLIHSSAVAGRSDRIAGQRSPPSMRRAVPSAPCGARARKRRPVLLGFTDPRRRRRSTPARSCSPRAPRARTGSASSSPTATASALAALGTVARLTASGPRRFEQRRRRLARADRRRGRRRPRRPARRRPGRARRVRLRARRRPRAALGGLRGRRPDRARGRARASRRRRPADARRAGRARRRARGARRAPAARAPPALQLAPLPLLDPAPAGRFRIDSVAPPEHYEAAVARAVEQIRAGAFEKIVLAREVTVHAPTPARRRRGLRRPARGLRLAATSSAPAAATPRSSPPRPSC